MNKKLFLSLPAVALLAASLLACGSEAAPAAGTEAVPQSQDTVAETEPVDALELRKTVDDGLGTVDFGGRDFRITAYNNNTSWYVMEAETGDVVDDAVLARTRTVEERFNVKVKVVFDGAESWETSSFIKNAINANDDVQDLISFHTVESGLVATSGYYLNWYDIPHIDFSKPWWPKSNVETLTYNDVCLCAVGDMNMTAIRNIYAIFENKRLAADYDIPDLFDTVMDGKWTFDYLVSLTKDVYQDLNGNGVIDNTEDFFGFAASGSTGMDVFQWAFDNLIFQKNAKGALEFTFFNERLDNVITKMRSTFNVYQGIRTDLTDKWNYTSNMFYDGKTIFSNSNINKAIVYRDMTDDYAILPYPKYDDQQKDYHTIADGAHEVLSVPTTASDLEFIGTITEAMNAESYKTVVPAYYDVAMKVKGTRDQESVAMLDLIVDSRVFDFGYVYDGWEGSSFFFTNLVNDSTQNLASFWESKRNAVTKHYDSVLQYFEDFDNQ